jgi:GMP synthase (glutamine-hydrolysing)
MKLLLIDNGTVLLRKLQRAIPCEVLVRTWNHLQGIPWKEIDGVILSGGSLFEIVGNESRLRDEMNIIHEEKKFLIGICFGCELIAETFGARLEKDRVDHAGITDIQVTQPDAIFGDQQQFSVCEHHRWLVKDLPADFDILAISRHGIEIFRHKTRPIYGVQFHPEQFEKAEDGERILLNILKKELGESTVA